MGNGHIGQLYGRVRGLTIVDKRILQKKARSTIYTNVNSYKIAPEIYNDTKVFSNNKSNEFLTSNIERCQKSETDEHSRNIFERNFSKRNGILNSNYRNIEEKNVKNLNRPTSKLKLELCLALYSLFSLIYLNILVLSERRYPCFSSMQEALLCKIIWCITFGVFVDLFSTKVALQIQSFFWVSLFMSKFLENSFLSNLFTKICISTSASLVTEITIIKFYKRENCWSPICRLSIFSSLYLLCGQFYFKDTFAFSREALWKFIQKYLLKAEYLDFFNYFTLFSGVDLSAIMNIVCALSLLTVAYLSNEQNEHSEVSSFTDSDEVKNDYSSKNRKIFSYIKMLILKIGVFLPAFCFLLIFNNYIKEWTLILIPLQVVALCALYVIGHYLSGVKIFAAISLLIFFFPFIMYCHYFHSWASTAALLFSVAVGAVKPLFQYYSNLELSESFAGISFSSFISLHFVMKYFTPVIIDAVISSDILNSFKLH